MDESERRRVFQYLRREQGQERAALTIAPTCAERGCQLAVVRAELARVTFERDVLETEYRLLWFHLHGEPNTKPD